MGARGTNALKRFLIGSSTAAVIEKSSCTVIAVPEEAQFRHISKIVFAANYETGDDKNVFDLVNFARRFSAEVILLHVSKGDRERAFEFSQVENFREKVQQETAYEKISAKLMDYENVYEGLNKYLEEINADLFALSMRNRSFYQRIFHPSLSKKMIYHSHLPVMVYHTDES
jgi:nucleotide-binding universal stress UspA family protein